MKNCKNCANRYNDFFLDRCMKSGWAIEIHRKNNYPACDQNFSGWQPRPSIFTRIKKFFTGW